MCSHYVSIKFRWIFSVAFVRLFHFFLDSMNARVFAMLWQGRDTPAAVVVGGDGDATSASSHKLIECAPVTGIECADGHGDESNAQSFSLPLPSSVSSNYAVGMFWSNFYIIIFFFRISTMPFSFSFSFLRQQSWFSLMRYFFRLPALAQCQRRHRHCVRARASVRIYFVSAFLSPILLSGVYKPRSVLYVNVICAQFVRSMTAAVVYVYLLKCECVQKI